MVIWRRGAGFDLSIGYLAGIAEGVRMANWSLNLIK